MFRSVIFSLCILMFLPACGPSSEITDSWIKPQANTADIKSIMVVAMVGENRELRQLMEQELATNLRNKGYTAFSSYAEYGPQMFDVNDEQKVLKQMRDKDVDAILTVVMLDKNKERYYVPGRVQYTPYAVYYNRFWGYFVTVYDRTYTPGYYATNTNYFWESNLYRMATGELIYSAQTRSFNPGPANALATEYAGLIIKDMTGKGLFTANAK